MRRVFCKTRLSFTSQDSIALCLDRARMRVPASLSREQKIDTL